jgi:type IV pilus assembly protein PilO
VKLNKIQQVIAGVVIILLTVVVSQFLVFKTDKQRIQSTDKNIQQLNQDINVAKAIQKSAAELQDEMIHLKAQLDRLKKILPVEINKPKFLADMKRYANENGIEILTLTNNHPVTTDVIVEHPFSFETRGNYHDLGYFFSQLTNYQRIINIKGMQLYRNADLKDYTVTSYFICSVFTYREPTEEELRQQIEAKKRERRR